MPSVLDPLLNGGYWFDAAIVFAALGLTWPIVARGRQPIPAAARITHSLILLFAVYVGTMAGGHLVAVTIKMAFGTLRSGSSLGRLFWIGFMFAIPAWSAVVATLRSMRRQIRA